MTDNISRIIREERLYNGLSLRELSKLTGISASHISRIENNKRKPSKDVLGRFATALSLSLCDLPQ